MEGQGTLRNKTVNGVLWSFVERFSVQGVVFLCNIVIARIIGPGNFGLIAMLAIFMTVSQVFIDGGFSSALIQRKDRSEADFSTVFYINIAISIIVYALLFLAAPTIAFYFEEPILEPITRVYSLNLILNSMVAVNRTKLTIDVDFKTQSKISLISAVIAGAAGIGLALMGYGVWSLVYQALILALLNVLLSFYYVRWWPSKNFSSESFHRRFSFGSKLLVANIISAAYTKVYNLVIGKRFSKEDLGLFENADKFNQFASSNLGSILQRVSFPVLSTIQDDDDRLRSAYKRFMQVSALIAFPLILGLCGIARPMIYTLLGEEWMGCVPILQILSLAYLWDCVIATNLNLIYVKGHSDYVLRLEMVKKSIAVAILLVSMFFGIIAICWGRVLYSIIALYLNTYYTKKLLNYGFLCQIKELLPVLAVSGVIAGMGIAMGEFIPNLYIAFVATLVACPVVYVLLCKAFRLSAYGELMTIIKEKLHGLKKH